MKKIDIIQFTPYFPPHKGGLETVGEEISTYWVDNGYGDFINVTTDFDQKGIMSDTNVNKVIYEGEVIGYIKNKSGKFVNIILPIPSREIIFNFPIYKFNSKKYKLIKKYLNERIQEKNNNFKVITHTRFFLQSFYGGMFAIKKRLQWIHVEHGSGYAKLSSKLKTAIGIIYDNLIGKWIFHKSDKILPISQACKDFVLKVGGKNKQNKIDVFYRGLDLGNVDINKSGDIKIIFIGRLVPLKGVSNLIEAYKQINIQNELIIIGDGDEKESLIKESRGYNIKFLGFQKLSYIREYLSQNNCVLVNPSYQEGLPTTVIEGLVTGNVVVATCVGGTKEISDKKDLILIESGNIKSLVTNLLYAISKYNELKSLSLIEVKRKFNRNKNILKLYELIKNG